jgi:putative ribosome biogenesis GTPase RsgA
LRLSPATVRGRHTSTVRELPDEYIVLADPPGVEPGAVAVTSKRAR